MRPEQAQEIDIAVLRQPLIIVDDDRIGRTITDFDQRIEGSQDRGFVGLDLLLGQHGARLVLAGRVADLGGAAAHQDDRLVAGLLHPAQHHDLHE